MCPPGVDQTTRTRQQWHLLAPTIQQRLQLGPVEGSCSNEDALQYLFAFDAFSKLARLPARAVRVRRADLGVLSKRKTSVTAVERLPAEVLDLIFGQVNKKDAVALGLTSSTLWMHLLGHIEHDVGRGGPWAGVPLLCTGTWLEDLPPAMYERFSEELESQKRYRKFMSEHLPPPVGIGRGSHRRWYGPCPARVWNSDAVSEYDEALMMPSREWINEWRELVAGAKLPTYMLATMWDALTDVAGSFAQETTGIQDWLLRNLTTKQYVRLNTKSASSGSSEVPEVHVAGARWLSIDQALLLRICWGSAEYRHSGNDYAVAMSRGKWAGHCFDIVAAQNVTVKGWDDVTEQIVHDGADWHKGSKRKRDN